VVGKENQRRNYTTTREYLKERSQRASKNLLKRRAPKRAIQRGIEGGASLDQNEKGGKSLKSLAAAVNPYSWE